MELINKLIKNTKVGVAVLLCLFACTDALYATHIVGGDLTYKCLGNNEYEFTLTFRRDCYNGDEEAGFDDPATLGVFNANGVLLTTIGEDGVISMPFMGRDTVVSELESNCSVSLGGICVEESVYTSRMVLPFQPGGYIIGYQRCCRNSTLSNVFDPLDTGSTYFVRISQDSYNECNNSPVFTNWPDAYVCVNEDLVFDHSAVDPDGDSLVYRLCVPTAGASAIAPDPVVPNAPDSDEYPYFPTVSWNPTYSLDNMLGLGTPLTIDAETGLLTALPGRIGQYLVGVCVEEYRDGKLIGITRRDFEYNILDCDQPLIADFTYDYTSCEDSELIFAPTINSENVTYTWNLNYPSQSTDFIVSGENPSFVFSKPGEYQVQLVVTRDDGCFVETIKTISAAPGGVDANVAVSIARCLEDGVDLLIEDNSLPLADDITITDRQWQIFINGVERPVPDLQSIMLSNVLLQQIDLTLTLTTSDGCVLVINESATLEDLLPQVMYEAMLIECLDGNMYTVQLSDATEYSAEAESWNWTITTDDQTLTFTEQTITLQIPATAIVQLEVYFANDCNGSLLDELEVFGDLLPALTFDVNNIDCTSDMSQYDLTIAPVLTGGNVAADVESYNWLIELAGETTTADSESIMLSIEDGQVASVSLDVTLTNGCVVTYAKIIDPQDYLPMIDIVLQDIACEGDDYNLTFDGIVPDGITIVEQVWTVINGQDTTQFAEAPFTIAYNPNDSLIITVSTKLDNGCIARKNETFTADDLNIIQPTFEINAVECAMMSDIPITLINTTEVESFLVDSVIWTITQGESNQTFMGDNVMTNVNALEDVLIELTLVFNSGCSTSSSIDMLDIDMNGMLNVEVVDPLTLCYSDTLEYFVINNAPEQDVDIIWEDHPLIVSVTDGKPLIGAGTEGGNYQLPFTASNNLGCTVMDTLNVVVMNQPTLDFDFEYEVCGETTVCFTPIGGATLYTWDFGDPASDSNAAIGTDVCHTYPALGSYNVSLESVGVCSGMSLTKQIALIDSTDANIIEVSSDSIYGCVNDTLTLSVSTELSDEYIHWLVAGDTIYTGRVLQLLLQQNADGTGQAQVLGTQTITDLGEFTVILAASDDCVYADSVVVDVYDFGPDTGIDTLDFTYSQDDCSTGKICFDANTDADGHLIWEINNGSSLDTIVGEESPCYTFSTNGTYDITLSAPDAPCSVASVTKMVSVGGGEDIMIEGVGVSGDTVRYCKNVIVSLTATSTVVADSLLVWCANGVELYTGSTFTFLGEDYDELTVKQSISSECADTASIVILPYDFGPGTNNDVLSFTYTQDDCNQPYICFEANTAADGHLVWEINNGSSLDTIIGNQFPCYTFSANGTYDVTLSAPDAPCTLDAVTMLVSVGGGDDIMIEGVGVSGDTVRYCENSMVSLTATSTAVADSTLVWCANGVELYTGAMFTFSGEDYDELTVKQSISGECADTVSITVLPYDFGPGTSNDMLSFTYTQDDCNEPYVCFEANTDADGYLVWQINNGTTTEQISGDPQPCFTFPANGVYTVGLYAPDAPCEVLGAERQIVVGGDHEIMLDGITGDTVQYCVGDSVTLSAMTNTGLTNFAWCIAGEEVAYGDSYTFLGQDVSLITVKLNEQVNCADTLDVTVLPYDFGSGTGIDSLEFTVSQQDCDVPEVCFEANTDAGGYLQWVISGPSTQDTILGNQDFCQTFELSGAYMIELSAPDAPCAVTSSNQIVNIFDQLPEVMIDGDAFRLGCLGDTVVLNATSNVDEQFIMWCDADGVTLGMGATIELPIIENTYYTAKVIGAPPECNGVDTVSVDGVDLTSIQIDVPDMDCSGEDVNATIIGLPTGDYSYVWTPAECFSGDTNSDNVTVSGGGDKTINVVVTDLTYGCSATASASLVLAEFADVELLLTPGDTIFRCDTVTLSVTNPQDGWTYDWSTGDTESTITDVPTESTTYTVTITDNNGCSTTLQTSVYVRQPMCNDSDVFIPTAFSPNGDNVNDVLLVRSNFIKSMELLVYDRWGEEIFKSTDQSIGWDGTYEGKLLAPDTYAYCLNVVCPNDLKFTKKGNVSLFR